MVGNVQRESPVTALNLEAGEVLIAHVPIPAMLIDNTCKLIAVNGRASDAIGISLAEASGMRLRDIFGGTLGKPGDPFVEDLKIGRTPKPEAITFTNESGLSVSFNITAEPILDEDGKSGGAILYLMSADRDKKMQDQIHLYEQVLDALPWPLSVTDMDTNITFINQASLNILKRTRKEMLGKKCHEWNGPVCRTKNCGIVMLKKGVNKTLSERDGKTLQIDVSYIKDAEGNNTGHIEIVQDITAAAQSKAYTDEWINQVRTNLKRLAEGNLDIDLQMKEPNNYTKELCEAYSSINKDLCLVSEAVMSLAQDASSLSQAAVDGTLATRADASAHKGVYREVVEGVNATLDAVIGPLNVAAAYVDRISKGAIPSKITKDYKGDFNVIKDNLNQCIDAINTLIEDSNMLASAAIQGQLDARADTSRHGGDFKKIVNGVNKTLDSIVGNLEAIPTPIMFMDKDLQIQYINHAGTKSLGKSKQELKGTTCASQWKTSKCGTDACPCSSAMRKNELVTCENDLYPQWSQIALAGRSLHESSHPYVDFQSIV